MNLIHYILIMIYCIIRKKYIINSVKFISRDYVYVTQCTKSTYKLKSHGELVQFFNFKIPAMKTFVALTLPAVFYVLVRYKPITNTGNSASFFTCSAIFCVRYMLCT
jgi:hypothetical protein